MNPTSDELREDIDELRRKVERLRSEADDLEEEADELQDKLDDLLDDEEEREVADMIESYGPWIEEIRGHSDIPEFQKLLVEEKLEKNTIRGSDLRQAYQSGGMMPPTDLIGLP